MKTLLTAAFLALTLSTGAALAQETGSTSGTTDGAAPTNQANPASEDDLLRPFYMDEAMSQPKPADQLVTEYNKLAPSQQEKVKSACSKAMPANLSDFCMQVQSM
jgi:hypothetical protein